MVVHVWPAICLTKTKHPEMTFVNVERSSLPEGFTSQVWWHRRLTATSIAVGTDHNEDARMADQSCREW